MYTGSGNDTLTQLGRFDNDFRTGAGVDIITPGLGHDFVDGGFDFRFGVEVFQGESDGLLPITIIDRAAFDQNPGDLLVLDYSTITGNGGVAGSVSIVASQAPLSDPIVGTLYTNAGSYTFSNPDGPDSLVFADIERLNVTGTNQDDRLVGTHNTFQLFGRLSNQNVRGDDVLDGNGGNDILIGYDGDDVLLGGSGDDILIGSDPNLNTVLEIPDETEIDILTGGTGADLFVLGVERGSSYTSFLSTEQDHAASNRAIIMDFTPAEGDRIQLYGAASDYRVEVDNGAILLFRFSPDNGDQLIGEIQNFTGFDLNASYVTYVNESTPSPFSTGRQALMALSAPAAVDAVVNELGPAVAQAAEADEPLVLAAAATPWVTQENDPNALKAKLGDGSGIIAGSASLTIEGNAEAFGAFDGDPFGLDSGIVLSTGKAADLAGPNIEDGSSTPDISLPRTFVKIGRVGATDIFRADLSGLGIDINSLTLRDSNSKVGGGIASDSGFDLDSVMLSRTLLDAVASPDDLNIGLANLDVFDFSAAGTVFHPGTQRIDVNPAHPDLSGSIEFGDIGLVLDAPHLGRVDADGISDLGNLTLGDGGSLAFNLTSTVSTDGPLYLYVGEDGAAGETLEGLVSVSSSFIQPDGDLSTDLGNLGTAGDTTKLTYAFMPDAGLNQIEFQFVLFSEELPERGGALSDIVTIRVNGIDYAALSDGASATLDNLLITPDGPAHPDLILNPAGTGPAAALTRADTYTRVLTLKAPVQPGVENILEVEVADKGDAFLDSGILIKGGSLVARAGTDFPGGAVSPPVAELPPVVEPATLSIVSTDAIRAEGDAGASTYTFTVYRTGNSRAAASASWAVSGQANAADFGGTLPSGTVSLAPGATSAQIVVTISGDTALESDEAFTMTLSNAVGAAIGTATASGKIINDDVGAPLSFLVSSDANGNVGNGDSGAIQDYIDISSDGRFVAFASPANNLVPDDTNNAIDVFVKDTWTGAITRVSTTSAGTQGSIFSVQAAISGDGRLAAFINGNNFDPADTGFNDVYVKDLTTGATVWATNMAGFSGGGDSDLAFSDNGRSIAFTTAKTLLPPGVDNFTSDVFVADLQTGTFVRASSTSTGAIANGDSSEASISGDGRFIAFTSTATNLATNDANGAAFDVYVKDLATGAVQLVSADAAGQGGNGQSFEPDISANGRYVAFYSNSSNLVANDTNGGADIFRRDLLTGEVLRVNTLADGSQVQFPGSLTTNSDVSISGDGHFVAFWGVGVVPGVNFFHVFVKDMQTNAVAAVPIGLDGLVNSDASIVPRISTDGRYIAFSTGATNLVTNDASPFYDVYIKPNPLIGAAEPISVSISDATVTEGDNGDTSATFTVTRTGGAGEFGVGYLIAGGTAEAGLDLSGGGGFITFAAGQNSQTITIAVTGDTTPEADETFTVDLSGATNAAIIGDGQGLGTIIDNDPIAGAPTAPRVSIGDVAILEGNAGVATARFTVSLSSALASPVTVAYGTADASAKAGSDYTAAAETVTFAPGETQKVIDVALNGDTTYENDETFLVRLSDVPAGIATGNTFAVGTIRNDDATPTGGIAVTISDVTVVEGDSGSTLATFTVARSVNDGAFTVGYATQDGTAQAPGDFTSASGTLSFAAGGELSQTITVPILGDALDESNETFSVVLQGLSNITGTAFIADGVGRASITDNDPAPTISITDAAVTEGNTGTTTATFTVSLSTASSKSITVDYGAVSDTATSLVDFARTSGRLTFAPGETSKEIQIAINGDTANESDERFAVRLSNAVNAVILDGENSVTIRNDDIATFSLGDRVWNDTDGDGVQDAGEAGITGVTVNLSIGDTLVASATTSAGGIYSFANLPANTYTVVVAQPAGLVPTFDLDGIGSASVATVNLTSNRADVDFGYRSPPNTPPVITFNGGNPASPSVPENTTAIATITVVDPDVAPQALADPAVSQQTLAFSLTGPDAASFAISSGGVLTFASPPDYENPSDAGQDNVYDVIVAVSDGANGSDSQAISVAVSNINETPVTEPADIDGAANAVTENAPAGIPVGITARAVDADGPDVISYALTSNPGGLFAIDAATGLVTVASAIDRETVGAATSVEVTATSTDGTSAAATFAIAISDADEFDVTVPEDVDAAANTVAENASAGTLVGITARALDGDSTISAVTYRLANNAGGRFAIDPISGVVAVAAGAILDFEAAASHGITIEALSADGSVATQDFTIAVSNVDEAAIIGGDRTGSVTEDLALAVSGQLTVSDPDTGQSLFQAGTIAGTYGSLALGADGAWTYALNNANAAVQALNSGQTLPDTITVRSLDGTTANIVIRINGNNDLNVITGTNGANLLQGTSAADLITPLNGPDAVFAGGGNDVIRSTPNDGSDLYDGGSGQDTVDYSALTQSVDVRLANLFGGSGLATGSQSGVDALVSIENVIGSRAGDRLVGNGSANVIEGGLGNDTLSGLGGADRIDGGAGNDRLTGGDGSDTFVFKPGFGNDVVTDLKVTGLVHDLIELDHSMFAQFATVQQLLASAQVAQVGADVVVTADTDDMITLQNASLATLRANADDFRFA